MQVAALAGLRGDYQRREACPGTNWKATASFRAPAWRPSVPGGVALVQRRCAGRQQPAFPRCGDRQPDVRPRLRVVGVGRGQPAGLDSPRPHGWGGAGFPCGVVPVLSPVRCSASSRRACHPCSSTCWSTASGRRPRSMLASRSWRAGIGVARRPANPASANAVPMMFSRLPVRRRDGAGGGVPPALVRDVRRPPLPSPATRRLDEWGGLTPRSRVGDPRRFRAPRGPPEHSIARPKGRPHEQTRNP